MKICDFCWNEKPTRAFFKTLVSGIVRFFCDGCAGRFGSKIPEQMTKVR